MLFCAPFLSLFYLIVSLFMEMLVLSVHCDIFSCLYMQIKLQDFYLSVGGFEFFGKFELDSCGKTRGHDERLYFAPLSNTCFERNWAWRFHTFNNRLFAQQLPLPVPLLPLVSPSFIPLYLLLSQTPHRPKKGMGGARCGGAVSSLFPPTPPRRHIKATQPINYSPEHLPAPTRSLCTLA